MLIYVKLQQKRKQKKFLSKKENKKSSKNKNKKNNQKKIFLQSPVGTGVGVARSRLINRCPMKCG